MFSIYISRHIPTGLTTRAKQFRHTIVALFHNVRDRVSFSASRPFAFPCLPFFCPLLTLVVHQYLSYASSRHIFWWLFQLLTACKTAMTYNMVSTPSTLHFCGIFFFPSFLVLWPIKTSTPSVAQTLANDQPDPPPMYTLQHNKCPLAPPSATDINVIDT